MKLNTKQPSSEANLENKATPLFLCCFVFSP